MKSSSFYRAEGGPGFLAWWRGSRERRKGERGRERREEDLAKQKMENKKEQQTTKKDDKSPIYRVHMHALNHG